jgi:predicted methyltransferase
MKRLRLAVALAAALVAGAAVAKTPAPGPQKAVRAAVAGPARPDADKARDKARHPAELMAFAEVRPGQTIVDFIPGGGYFTRIFSGVVGPKGRVYAVFPQFMYQFETMDVASIKALVADPHFANVRMVVAPDDSLDIPGDVDLVWTSQNYHDLQFGLSHEQIVGLDKSVFNALKPGGIFLVIDHVAAAGSGWTVAKTLHRIDPDAIKADTAEAGFVLEAESNVLHNPDDPHTAIVFDPSIRGKTDQVVFRFRKPK